MEIRFEPDNCRCALARQFRRRDAHDVHRRCVIIVFLRRKDQLVIAINGRHVTCNEEAAGRRFLRVKCY